MEQSDSQETFFDKEALKRILIRFLVTFSYTVWTAVALDCIMKYSKSHGKDFQQFAYGTFVLSAFNGVMGIPGIVDEDFLYALKNTLDLLLFLMALPCLSTEVWLKYKVAQKEIAWFHAIVGVLPASIYLFQHYTRWDLIELAIATNVVSLAGVGFLYKDYFAVAASLMFVTAFFFVRRRVCEIDIDSTRKQCFNYCMALFTYCAYRTAV